MSKFIVLGGQKLQGRVRIQGSKNSAFPAIAASLLTAEECRIKNVPDISDVRNFLEILKFLGADFEFGNHELTITTARARNKKLPKDLAGKLRGSILFAGSLLARFGEAELGYPGGDAFGSRPIDVHLDGFKRLGADVHADDFLKITGKPLLGTKIKLAIPSVTGTENLILASVLAQGETELENAAREPHVGNLCQYLNKMGANISGIGTSHLKIAGVARLKGAEHELNPDEIDAVTFCAAAAATKGSLDLNSLNSETLEAPIRALREMGVNLEIGQNSIRINPPEQDYKAIKIITGVYPALLTDEQPLLGVLATQSYGMTQIHDWFHEGRQGYLHSLVEMGAEVYFKDIHQANIIGPSRLSGTEMRTPDLRAGASILIASLVADGRSIIYNAEIIDRGYERIDERLRSLGANIERVN